MSDLDLRRRGGKSQGRALFQLRSESLHLSNKVFLWEGEKKGEVCLFTKNKRRLRVLTAFPIEQLNLTNKF